MPDKNFSTGTVQTVGCKVKNVSLTMDFSEDADYTQEAIDFRGFNLLSLKIPAVDASADINIFAATVGDCPDESSPTPANFAQLNTHDGTVVQIANANLQAGEWHTFVGDAATAIAACDFIIINFSASQTSDITIEAVCKT